MATCEQNPFCRRLPEETRMKLCKHCIKSTFAEGTMIAVKADKPFLVLEGTVLVENDEKPVAVLIPGSFFTTPQFAPERYAEIIVSEESATEQHSRSRFYFAYPTTFAFFSNRIVRELMDDNHFLRLLYDFDVSQINQQLIYQRYLYQKSAEESVRYVLKLARVYGMTGLTHEKIARFSGRRRPTVTQILHRLAISEPELLAVLD